MLLSRSVYSEYIPIPIRSSVQVFMPLLSFSQLKNAEALASPGSQSRAVSRQDTVATQGFGENEKESEAKVILHTYTHTHTHTQHTHTHTTHTHTHTHPLSPVSVYLSQVSWWTTLLGSLDRFQSAHLSGHNTETVMLHVLNGILCSADRGDLVLLVLLDLITAFDTIDHHILLKRLHDEIDITDLVTSGSNHVLPIHISE